MHNQMHKLFPGRSKIGLYSLLSLSGDKNNSKIGDNGGHQHHSGLAEGSRFQTAIRV